MQRLAESAQMAEWIAKEGDFQLEQERRRAGIRLKEKRGKAIDFLALNLKYATDGDGEEVDDGLGLDDIGLEIDFDEPYVIFEVRNNAFPKSLHSRLYRTCHWNKRKNCTTTSRNTYLLNNRKLILTFGR